MTLLSKMSPEAMIANIEFYKHERQRMAEFAIQAWANELKWTQLLAQKQNPEAALKNVLSGGEN